MQAKKVKGVQAAFKVYNVAMRTPGRGELTMVELRVGTACVLFCSTSAAPRLGALELFVVPINHVRLLSSLCA